MEKSLKYSPEVLMVNVEKHCEITTIKMEEKKKRTSTQDCLKLLHVDS